MSANSLDGLIQILRTATLDSPYERMLFLVGGFVRDKVMGLSTVGDDIDIVLEGDSIQLANFLFDKGVAQYPPVVYPRFGTAMIVVSGQDVEIVTARIESYAPHSRKPEQVKVGTLAEDALRRDFTINTLLQNLHTEEILDPLGLACQDIESRVLRTPTDPSTTFNDDPLRMLRAIRFSTRLDFNIEQKAWDEIKNNASRLKIVSMERIRDEFSKVVLSDRASEGLTMLLATGLLLQFAPELVEMKGVTQNSFHIYDVWDHTLAALASLPKEAPIELRLATLLHDSGKPATRTVDADDNVHFYYHQDLGAKIAQKLLQRLKYPNLIIKTVVRLVAEHMRIGEYNEKWKDSAVRRLVRDLGDDLENLFALHRADVAGLSRDHQDMARAVELHQRIDEVQFQHDITTLTSPLNGQELMQLLELKPGSKIGEIKDYLTNEVVEGRLDPHDKISALKLAEEKLSKIE